jgi:hypothetical protein
VLIGPPPGAPLGWSCLVPWNFQGSCPW